MPGWNALGGLGILLALLLLILDGRAQHQADEADRSFERKARGWDRGPPKVEAVEGP